MGDNIFDINIDFEDLGEDASNISLPKSLKAPNLKPKKNKSAQTSKKPLIKKVKSVDNKAVKKTDIEKPKTDVAQNNNHKLNNKNKAVSVTKTDSKYKVIDSLSSAGKLSKKSFHKKPDYRQKRINKTQELKKNITSVSSKTNLAENIIVKRFNLNNTYSNKIRIYNFLGVLLNTIFINAFSEVQLSIANVPGIYFIADEFENKIKIIVQ